MKNWVLTYAFDFEEAEEDTEPAVLHPRYDLLAHPDIESIRYAMTQRFDREVLVRLWNENRIHELNSYLDKRNDDRLRIFAATLGQPIIRDIVICESPDDIF